MSSVRCVCVSDQPYAFYVLFDRSEIVCAFDFYGFFHDMRLGQKQNWQSFSYSCMNKHWTCWKITFSVCRTHLRPIRIMWLWMRNRLAIFFLLHKLPFVQCVIYYQPGAIRRTWICDYVLMFIYEWNRKLCRKMSSAHRTATYTNNKWENKHYIAQTLLFINKCSM